VSFARADFVLRFASGEQAMANGAVATVAAGLPRELSLVLAAVFLTDFAWRVGLVLVKGRPDPITR